jgi:arylsulfatase A-like enzyme
VLDDMKKLKLTQRCFLIGIMIGIFVGIWEGSILLLYQRPLTDHGVSLPILILAPLLDGVAFGILGAILGAVAGICEQNFPRATSLLVAFGFAIVGAYLTFLPAHAWIRASRFPHLVVGGVAIMGGLILAVTAVMAWPIILSRYIAQATTLGPPSSALFRRVSCLFGTLLAILVITPMIIAPAAPRVPPHANGAGNKPPNIVMIALDAAGADHFSAYGYTRPTTPHIDRLAGKGVLFETAIAPAPWTLPSFAAVFTGLLPHQNHAGSQAPLAKGLSTLASILGSRGYQTGGFNANFSYGTARTGLAQGFDRYDDDDGSFRTNLASIGFVKAFWWLVYYPFIRADALQRRDARTLNQPIFQWLGHSAKQPFFLFVNYFDTHEPYSAIPEIDNRFGNTHMSLAQRIRADIHGMPSGIEVPRSPAEQAMLVAAYDSSLAYADRQIGSLLQLFESSPEWANTYIIVFGDHGQAFGTHRHYGHGWGLNGELLHVPLIIAGPGIPAGRRVKDLVGLQQLFATVLDLSGGGSAAPAPSSLRCSWILPPKSCDSAPMVISELSTDAARTIAVPSISVVTPEWHFIRDATGELQLYDLTHDRGEEVNLAGSPQYQSEREALQSRLFEKIQTSAHPWLAEDYLWALGERDFSLLARGQRVHSQWPYWNTPRHSTQENELLHSLPYQ